MMCVEQITTGKRASNCYVIHRGNREAVIIDPGGEGETIIRYIERAALQVMAILNTHAHHDHIGAAAMLKDKYGVPFYLDSREVKLMTYANLYRKLFDGEGPIPLPNVDYYIDNVELPVRVGEFSIEILFTPGHTQGGVSFLIEDYVFTGDTLFRGRIGRVDELWGDKSGLRNSLGNLAVLPPATKICPGHGRMSTMMDEMRTNGALLEAINAS